MTAILLKDMSPEQRRVLKELSEEVWYGYDQLAADANVPINQTKRIVREFYKAAIVDYGYLGSEDDHLLRGKGYWIIGYGRRMKQELHELEFSA